MTFQLTQPGVSNYSGNLAQTIQPEILIRQFQDAATSNLRYRGLYEVAPIPSAVGQNFDFTAVGLLTDADDPITPAANTDLNNGMTPQSPTAVEQYRVKLNKYGNTLDTNLVSTSIAIDNQVYRNAKDLGINAGRSLDKAARRFLFAAYGGGTTYVTTTAGASTSINIANAFGFDTVMVSGVQTQVSVTNPLAVTIGANSVNITGVSGVTVDKDIEWAPGTLTIDVATAVTAGDLVKAANAPAQRRPGALTNIYSLTATSYLTLQDLMFMEAQLEEDNIPPMTESGYYHMILSPVGMNQLFNDTAFQSAFRGLGEQDVYARNALGALSNMLFFKTALSPKDSRTLGAGALTVRNAILVGGGGCVEGRYDNIDKLKQLADLNTGLVEQDYDPESGIMMMYRGPYDRHGEIIGLSWKYLGGFTQRTDSLTLTPNTGASINRIYGRAIVSQHT
jgi:hypothetical protein